MSLNSNVGVKLFDNRARSRPGKAEVNEYTTRFFLAALEKLDLLTGKSDYTQQEWFNIICAAVLFRTVVPGNAKYAEALEPKSTIVDSGPEVAPVMEGVTITGAAPIRFTIHDLISDYFRLESVINLTVSDILSGFDETKVSKSLENLKLKYDTVNVERLIGHLNSICEMLEEGMDPEAAVTRFGESLGSAVFDPEQYSRQILKEPEFYLENTRFKVGPNTLLSPDGFIPPLTPYSTLKAFEINTGILTWNPITARTVALDGPPAQVEQLVGNQGGVRLEIIPYNVSPKYRRFTCVGEVIYVGHTTPKGLTGTRDKRELDVKVYSVATNSFATYTVDSLLDKCWLLFDATGLPSDYVKDAVKPEADLASHPYYNGTLDFGDAHALASKMEKAAPSSQSDFNAVFPATRIVRKADKNFSTHVAKFLGDFTLQGVPRDNFGMVARQIAASLGPDIHRAYAEFNTLDREIFTASQSSYTDDEKKALGAKMATSKGMSFAVLTDADIKGQIPPGAGPYEYLVQLADSPDVFREYSKKAAQALALLNRIYAGVNQYLGDSRLFQTEMAPAFALTKSGPSTFYYALSGNNWHFLSAADASAAPAPKDNVYFGVSSKNREESTKNRGRLTFTEDGGLVPTDSLPVESPLIRALSYASIHTSEENGRKRKRSTVSSKSRRGEEMDLSSMTKSRKKVSSKKPLAKKLKSTQPSADFDEDVMDLQAPDVFRESMAEDANIPVDLALRIATIDQAGSGLISAIVLALCFVDFTYAGLKKLTSQQIILPFPFAACSKLVLEVKKTLFLRRSREGEDNLYKGAGIQLAVFDPISLKQAFATEKVEVKLRHRNVMNIATDVTGFPSHISKYYSGRNRIFFDGPEQYERARDGEGEPDTLVIPVFFGEYPGTEYCAKPFVLAEPTDEGCPQLSHPIGQTRFARMLLKSLAKPIAPASCLFDNLEDALSHQPAYWLPGSYWQTDLDLKKDIFYKGQIIPNQRAHLPGAKPGYYGEKVLGTTVLAQVDLV